MTEMLRVALEYVHARVSLALAELRRDDLDSALKELELAADRIRDAISELRA